MTAAAPMLFPRFAVGDVITTPWGNKPGRPKVIENVYLTGPGGDRVIAYDTQVVEDQSALGWGGFTEDAEGIDRVRVIGRADPTPLRKSEGAGKGHRYRPQML